MPNAIEKHEAYLLRKEPRIRRDRHLAFWYGLCMLALPLPMTAMIDKPDTPSQILWIGVFSLIYAYTCHLKVQHVESIRFHRGEEVD